VKTAPELVRALLVVGLLPLAARASPTGLNQIPTPDLVPWKQLTLQLANGNMAVTPNLPVWHAPQVEGQTQFGLPWNMEAGLDVAPINAQQDYRPELNIKWVPINEDYYVPATAIGVTQLGVGFTPGYYLVASKTVNYSEIAYQKFRAHHRNIKLRGFRVMAGIQGSGNAWRALVGSDYEVSDHFIVEADWISGAQNSVSLGGVLVINQHDSVTLALLHGNDQVRLMTGVLLQLTHTFDVTDPFTW
jgi:hypothetical protein